MVVFLRHVSDINFNIGLLLPSKGPRFKPLTRGVFKIRVLIKSWRTDRIRNWVSLDLIWSKTKFWVNFKCPFWTPILIFSSFKRYDARCACMNELFARSEKSPTVTMGTRKQANYLKYKTVITVAIEPYWTSEAVFCIFQSAFTSFYDIFPYLEKYKPSKSFKNR